MIPKPTTRAALAAILSLALGIPLASCGGGAAVSSLPMAETGAVASPLDQADSLLEGRVAAAVIDGVVAAPDASPEAGTAGVATASASAELSEAEVEALRWMREEEKLARDVYLAMHELWGTAIFENIARSEVRHMEAVLGLIEAYGLEDPVADDAPGAFTDPELAVLYTDLVERGSVSLMEALTVGALIEDLDILDLEERLAATDRDDVTRVFENLVRGSQNHLRAFTSRLAAEGAGYESVYHSDEEIAVLLAGPEGGAASESRRHRGGRSR